MPHIGFLCMHYKLMHYPRLQLVTSPFFVIQYQAQNGLLAPANVRRLKARKKYKKQTDRFELNTYNLTLYCVQRWWICSGHLAPLSRSSLHSIKLTVRIQDTWRRWARERKRSRITMCTMNRAKCKCSSLYVQRGRHSYYIYRELSTAAPIVFLESEVSAGVANAAAAAAGVVIVVVHCTEQQMK